MKIFFQSTAPSLRKIEYSNKKYRNRWWFFLDLNNKLVNLKKKFCGWVHNFMMIHYNAAVSECWMYFATCQIWLQLLQLFEINKILSFKFPIDINQWFEFPAIKICITNGFEKQCDQLARETQEVQCVRVQDSIECAKILSKSSGFGIFSAESMLLLAALKYDGLTVLKELKHRDRLNREYESYECGADT